MLIESHSHWQKGLQVGMGKPTKTLRETDPGLILDYVELLNNRR